MALSSAAFNNKVELTAVTATPHEHVELKWSVLLERALVKGTTVASLSFKLVKSKIG